MKAVVKYGLALLTESEREPLNSGVTNRVEALQT